MKCVKAAILFGSFAKGRQRADSDIDICVITEGEGDSPLELSSDKIDISLFHKLPLIVRYRVFRDGKVLFCRDGLLLTKLRFWTIKIYLDEKHWRDAFVAKVLS
jgi:predicted nucleotidyltransferase